MFRIFLKSLVAIPTFLIGVTIFVLVSFQENPQPVIVSNDEPPNSITIDACDLGETSGKYIGKRIVVDATIYSIEDHIVIYPVSYCHEGYNPFVNTDLDLQSYFGGNQGLKYALRDRKPKSEIDVRIEGTVRRAEKNDELVHYIIVPTDIEVISPWRKFEPKAAS